MANVVLKTEEEQGTRVTSLPLPPALAASASVEAVEANTASPVTSLASAVPASTSSPSSRRYDQVTIEKALAIAMQMQQEHQATLSTEQVFRLAEEVNVDRAFMLRALAQVDGTAADSMLATTPQTQATRATQALVSEQGHGLAPLPLLSRYMAVVIPLLFAIVSFCVFTAPGTRLDRSDNTFALLWMFLGGPLLALLMGIGLRRVRLGLASGFCVGLFLFSAAMLPEPNPNRIELAQFFTVLFLFIAVGSALGAAGVALPRFYRRALIALVRQFPHLAEEAR